MDDAAATAKKREETARSVSSGSNEVDNKSFVSEKDIRRAIGTIEGLNNNDIDMEFKRNHPELFIEEDIVPLKQTNLKLHVKDSAKVVIENLGSLR